MLRDVSDVRPVSEVPVLPVAVGRRGRPLTIVCHLLAEPAASGRLVGHVEVVNTGEVATISDVEQLIALVTRSAERDE